MTRINLSNTRETSFLTWGKNASALVFAAVLIICSIAVGCSSDKPKPITINNPVPAAEPQAQPMPTMPVAQAENKPAGKKPVVRKRPATVNYADKTYGVTFEYPRRYAIETGDAATQLILSNAIPMNFVQPGGIALAAVELPETNYVNTDFSSAFFNVSMNKRLTAEQCGQFSGPQAKAEATEAKTEVQAEAKTEAKTDSTPAATPQISKVMIGDMELKSTDTLTSDGSREQESKYYHVFENGACYEFAIKVATGVETDEGGKAVDREDIFKRLEKILATVKITAAPAPEVTASAPVTPAVPVTPAQ